MKRYVLAVVMVCAFPIHSLRAQEAAPVLVAELPSSGREGKREPLAMTEVKVDAILFGRLAETEITMTFANPHDRPLAGEFCFPLPEGATVNGYALDINGVMVDGVVVGKRKAREVFEKEARKGIDPGIVEWAKGNNFKTRIFPIPARGTRTARVRFVSDIVENDRGSVYQVPLNFQTRIPRFSLRIEVVKGERPPSVEAGRLGPIAFKEWRDSYVAETRAEDVLLADEIAIVLPPVKTDNVLVQKASDGEFYFCVNSIPPRPSPAPADGIRKVTLLWDASGSRANADHRRELDLIRSFFAGHKAQAIEVDLVTFSDTAADPKHFVVLDGDAGALVKELQACVYDGGTQMGALSEKPGAALPDCYWLFTDGLSNFGREDPAVLSRPVYAFSSAGVGNPAFLQYLAVRTGGRYFNLKNAGDAEILSGIGCAPFMFLGATAEAGAADGLCPGRPEAAHRSVAVVGKLKAEQVRISLRFGVKDNATHAETVTVNKADAAAGDLLRRYWAQRRIHELLVFPEKNKAEIASLGKAHGVVTPGTSLIVLERLEQYVEHQIAPPASLPEMRREYLRRMAEQERKRKKKDEEKITQILKLWNERVEWWNREFTYPKGFKFQEAIEKNAALASLGIQFQDHLVSDGANLRTLRWLKTQAADDGSWGQSVRDTSLVLLAYLDHGETPASEEFGKTVENAIKFLVKVQGDSGRFSEDPDTQAMAAFALNEMYGMTRIPLVKAAAEKATAVVLADLRTMDKPGGWQASALKSARNASVDPAGLAPAMQDTAGKLKKQSTAGAWAGLQVLGQASSPEARGIAASLESMEFDWRRYSLEELYFATRAKFRQGGETWRRWNREFSPKLVEAQTVQRGAGTNDFALGFWLSPNEHDQKAGRVYCTALASSMLHVYYRYVPSYVAVVTNAAGEEVPAELDSVDMVRSPVIFRGVYGGRSPGARGSLSGGGGSARADEPRPDVVPAPAPPEPAIVIKPWDPQTPYLQELKKAQPGDRYRVYLEQKKTYGDTPAFFLDCSDYFFREKQADVGLRILSNIAELKLENAALLRILGHKLDQVGALEASVLTFEEVLRLRPEDPQSCRDLALVLEKKGDTLRAAELLYRVVMAKWDRFADIEAIALMELNRLFPKLNEKERKKLAMDPRLVKRLDVDIRIVMTWDADLTDVDLWVTEPSGEKAFFSHSRTLIGGHVSRDFTQGYGPEEYFVRKAMNGIYKIEANYYGQSAPELMGPVTLHLDIFTNYGRPNETRRSLTLRLAEKKETVTAGEIEF